MKKIYLSILILSSVLFTVNSFGTTHIFTVQDFAFAPTTTTVTVGDTIKWTWVGGTHNTTSTANIPAGANSWSNPINSNNQEFIYVVVVAGSYSFRCTFHASMTAQFTALANGINTPVSLINFNISPERETVYNISYALLHSSDIRLTIYDVTGKSVKTLISSTKLAGEYTETCYLDDLRKGIYIVEFLADNQRISKRLIIQ